MGFRATLNFWKFKVALNLMRRIFKSFKIAFNSCKYREKLNWEMNVKLYWKLTAIGDKPATILQSHTFELVTIVIANNAVMGALERT